MGSVSLLCEWPDTISSCCHMAACCDDLTPLYDTLASLSCLSQQQTTCHSSPSVFSVHHTRDSGVHPQAQQTSHLSRQSCLRIKYSSELQSAVWQDLSESPHRVSCRCLGRAKHPTTVFEVVSVVRDAAQPCQR
jgi:hypothetical protein